MENIASIVADQVPLAAERISGDIFRTPLLLAPWLAQYSEDPGTKVWLKLESEQITGSYKARGAINKLLTLTEEEKKKGVVTASSGNHGLATAFALQKQPLDAQIVLPETASKAKISALRELQAPLTLHGRHVIEAEIHAANLASQQGMVYISPYNDVQICAGQGTQALEILSQMQEPLHAVFVPVGSGGSISGISAYLKQAQRDVQVIGCSPAINACMMKSVEAGRILAEGEFQEEETIADGAAGGIEPDSITFPIVQQCVDGFVAVSEDEIGMAMVETLQKARKLVEGASAAAIAAWKKEATNYKGKNVVIVCSGGNVKAGLMKSLLNKYLE